MADRIISVKGCDMNSKMNSPLPKEVMTDQRTKMAKKIQIHLTREQAEELFEIKLQQGICKEEDREEEIKNIMKPKHALFG